MTPGAELGCAAQGGAAHGPAGPRLEEHPGPDLGQRPLRHHHGLPPGGGAAPVSDRVNVAVQAVLNLLSGALITFLLVD